MKKRFRGIWWVLGVAVVASAVFTIVATTRPETSESPRATVANSESELTPAIATPLALPMNDASDFALYAPAVPLPQRLPSLLKRAEAGDRQAACYIGVMFARCGRLPAMRSAIARLETRASKTVAGSDEEKQLIAELQTAESNARDLGQSCSGTNEPNDASWKHLLAAAEAGSEPATLALATAPPLNMDQPLADIERWNQYKQDVPRLLREAASRGSVPALFLSLGIYSGQDSIAAGGGPFVPRAPALALSYALVLDAHIDNLAMRNMVRQSMDELRAELTPAQIESARTAAEAMDSRAFPAHIRITGLGDVSATTSPESCLESR